MKAFHIIRIYGALALIGILAGCESYTQTTSGKDYLAKYPIANAEPATEIDNRVRAAADVEPLLRFPARIGLARIGGENGHAGLGVPSPEEAKAWSEAAQRLGPKFGEFVPVSPLIAAMLNAP